MSISLRVSKINSIADRKKHTKKEREKILAKVREQMEKRSESLCS